MPVNLVAETLRLGLFTSVAGKRLVHFEKLGSTMDEAARQARQGAAEGTVVIAEEQLGGRGRFQRPWVSPPGNLLLSVVLRPSIETLHYVGIIASLAVRSAIQQTTGLAPTLKWPNDVRLRGRKVSGILVESAINETGVQYAILGIGVNVNFAPAAYPELAGAATSLSEETGKTVSRAALLKSLLEHLDRLYVGLRQGARPLKEWKALLDNLGKEVQVRWGDNVETGIAEDVDETGNLILRRGDGSRVTVTAGDVSTR